MQDVPEGPREAARREAEIARDQAREARRLARKQVEDARRRAADARREALRAAREHRRFAAPLASDLRVGPIQLDARPGHAPLRPGLISGGFFTIVGAAFLADAFDIFRFDPVYIWPLLAICLGLSEVMGRSTRLKVERARTTQLTVAEERVRIARELHDIVAHSVSLMTVQIAAARRVFHKRPEEAESALESAEATGRQSLAELRSLVNILRSADASIEAASLSGSRGTNRSDASAPLPGLSDITALVEGMKEAGMVVRLSMSGKIPAAPPGVQLAVYRVLQEALTNTMRHGSRTPVDVAIVYKPDGIELTIENEIDIEAVDPNVEGHGVIGMRERVAAVGGSLEAGPAAENRWRVQATIPNRGTS